MKPHCGSLRSSAGLRKAIPGIEHPAGRPRPARCARSVAQRPRRRWRRRASPRSPAIADAAARASPVRSTRNRRQQREPARRQDARIGAVRSEQMIHSHRMPRPRLRRAHRRSSRRHRRSRARPAPARRRRRRAASRLLGPREGPFRPCAVPVVLRQGHDPVCATRPPNRRSRRRYSAMAPSSAARSKSGQ